MPMVLSREWLLDQFVEPVLLLELRQLHRRWSGWAIPLAVLVFVLTAAAFQRHADAGPSREALERAPIGYFLFAIIVILAQGHRMALERGSGEFDMLAMTAMRSSQIADQRILAAAAPALGLLVTCLPLALVVIANGGASVPEVAALFALLVLTTLLASAVFVGSPRCQLPRITFAAALYCGISMIAVLTFIFLLPTSARGSAHVAQPADGLRSWAFTAAMAWLYCSWFAACLSRSIQKRFPIGHPRRRLALVAQAVGTAAVAALFLNPAVDSWFAKASCEAWAIATACVTPSAAIRELVGTGPYSNPGIPAWMPAYGIAVFTLAFQVAGVSIMRRGAASAIESCRRTS